MSRFRRGDFVTDAYAIEEESDEELIESSEDEVDMMLRDSRGQQPRLSRRHGQQRRRMSSSEDEFEKEMSAELSKTMKDIYSLASASVPAIDFVPATASSTTVPSASVKAKTSKSRRARNVDEIYFGSDSDEDEFNKDTGPALSNDDLLYDPEMDDDDQDWVDNQRRDYLGKQYGHKAKKQKSGEQAAPQKLKRLPHSDAVLNCPACMTLLTLDCQRHEKHHNQYRAMFVSNCIIDSSERLRFPVKDDSKLSGRSKNKNKKKKTKASRYEPREQLINGGDVGHKLCDSALAPVDSNEMDSSSFTQNDSSKLSENGLHGTAEKSLESTDFPTESANVGASARMAGNSGETTGESPGMVGNFSEVLAGEKDETYNQVKCVVCNTVVGVYDSDEVYHFFNVLSSYS